MTWNRWFASEPSDEERAELLEMGYTLDELTPFPEDRSHAIRLQIGDSEGHDFFPPPNSRLLFLLKISYSHIPSLLLVRLSGGTFFFDGAIFTGAVRFGGAIFSSQAKFDSTTFSGEAYFDRATFSLGASFENATFSSLVSLVSTTFRGVAFFNSATFSGQASFGDRATFSGDAEFRSTRFGGDAEFRGATFSGEAGFTNAEMKGVTTFTKAKFARTPSFFGAKLHEGTTWSDITWPPRPGNREQAAKDVEAYERIKLEMDRLKKHGDELDFFARELQCRRVLLGPRKGLPFAIYGFLSDYGRSYGRPLLLLVATILVGTLVVAAHCVGFWTPLLSDLDHTRQSLGISFANTLGLLGRPLMKPEVLLGLPDWLKAVATIQSILGIVLLFLFGLGIRNRFRMK